MKLKRIGALIASTVMVGTTLSIMPVSTAETALKAPTPYSGACGDVHIVSANGTGWGGRNKQDNASDFMMKPLVDSVKSQLPGKVSNYDITYPASVGALASLSPQADNSATYGLSRLEGDMKGLKHLQDFHNKCPNSMIVFTGYSQGASVAGDLAALVANGAVPGMGPDNILGAVLLADPGRGGTSQYTGPKQNTRSWIPLPPNVKYNRNGEVSTATSNSTVGWTGQRSLPFTGIEGRVISICNDSDTACAAQKGSALRALADMSDKDIWPNVGYRHGDSLFSSVIAGSIDVVPNLLSAFPQLLKSTDYGPVFDRLEQQFYVNKTANKLDRAVLMNAVNELRGLFAILHRGDMYGPNTADNKILGHLLGVGYPMLKPQLKNMGINPQHVDMVEPFVTAATGLVSGIDPLIVAKTEPTLKKIANFQKDHAVYFNAANYPVESKSAMQWGADAIVQGVRNYQSGHANTTNADPRNSGTEVAEPNRKDDGLKSLLGYLQNGTSVLGQETNDYPQPRVPVDPSLVPKPGITDLKQLMEEAARENLWKKQNTGEKPSTSNNDKDRPYYSYMSPDPSLTQLPKPTDSLTVGKENTTSSTTTPTTSSVDREKGVEEEIVEITHDGEGNEVRVTSTRRVDPDTGKIISTGTTTPTTSSTSSTTSSTTSNPEGKGKDKDKDKDKKDDGPRVNTGGSADTWLSRIAHIFL